MSLKTILLNKLKSQSYTKLEELYFVGKDFKQSNVERTLRKICEESIYYPHKSPNGYIVGYLKAEKTPHNAPVSVPRPKEDISDVQPKMFDLEPTKKPKKLHQDYI